MRSGLTVPEDRVTSISMVSGLLGGTAAVSRAALRVDLVRLAVFALLKARLPMVQTVGLEA